MKLRPSKKPRKGQFQKGNKARLGSKNPNAGRPPDEFKERMRQLATREKRFEWMEAVIDGDDDTDEFLVLQTGVQVPIKADGNLRLKIIQYCDDRAFGKSTQSIEHTGTVSLEQIVAGSMSKDEPF